MRDSGVTWDEGWRGWIVAGHKDVAELLSSDRMTAERLPNIGSQQSEDTRVAADIMSRWIVFLDPPKHTAIRPKVAPPFSPRAIREIDGLITSTFREHMESLRGQTEMDFMREVAFPFPATVIAGLFGVPAADLPVFGQWSDDVASLMHSGSTEPAQGVQSLLQLADYLRSLFRSGVTGPLMKHLDGLDEEDLVATCVLFLFAGHETTKNLLGNMLVTLSDWPEEQRRLWSGEVSEKRAVEELLRYEGPAKATVRIAARDVAIGDTVIEAGQKILLALGGANRDPKVFDRPDDLVLERSESGSLAFGYGIHFCVGAPLARFEAQVALRELPRFWTGYGDVPPPEDRQWQPRLLNRGLDELPMRVAWR
jgi:cytochrome P450